MTTNKTSVGHVAPTAARGCASMRSAAAILTRTSHTTAHTTTRPRQRARRGSDTRATVSSPIAALHEANMPPLPRHTRRVKVRQSNSDTTAVPRRRARKSAGVPDEPTISSPEPSARRALQRPRHCTARHAVSHRAKAPKCENVRDAAPSQPTITAVDEVSIASPFFPHMTGETTTECAPVEQTTTTMDENGHEGAEAANAAGEKKVTPTNVAVQDAVLEEEDEAVALDELAAESAGTALEKDTMASAEEAKEGEDEDTQQQQQQHVTVVGVTMDDAGLPAQSLTSLATSNAPTQCRASSRATRTPRAVTRVCGIPLRHYDPAGTACVHTPYTASGATRARKSTRKGATHVQLSSATTATTTVAAAASRSLHTILPSTAGTSQASGRRIPPHLTALHLPTPPAQPIAHLDTIYALSGSGSNHRHPIDRTDSHVMHDEARDRHVDDEENLYDNEHTFCAAATTAPHKHMSVTQNGHPSLPRDHGGTNATTGAAMHLCLPRAPSPGQATSRQFGNGDSSRNNNNVHPNNHDTSHRNHLGNANRRSRSIRNTHLTSARDVLRQLNDTPLALGGVVSQHRRPSPSSASPHTCSSRRSVNRNMSVSSSRHGNALWMGETMCSGRRRLSSCGGDGGLTQTDLCRTGRRGKSMFSVSGTAAAVAGGPPPLTSPPRTVAEAAQFVERIDYEMRVLEQQHERARALCGLPQRANSPFSYRSISGVSNGWTGRRSVGDTSARNSATTTMAGGVVGETAVTSSRRRRGLVATPRRPRAERSQRRPVLNSTAVRAAAHAPEADRTSPHVAETTMPTDGTTLIDTVPITRIIKETTAETSMLHDASDDAHALPSSAVCAAHAYPLERLSTASPSTEVHRRHRGPSPSSMSSSSSPESSVDGCREDGEDRMTAATMMPGDEAAAAPKRRLWQYTSGSEESGRLYADMRLNGELDSMPEDDDEVRNGLHGGGSATSDSRSPTPHTQAVRVGSESTTATMPYEGSAQRKDTTSELNCCVSPVVKNSCDDAHVLLQLA